MSEACVSCQGAHVVRDMDADVDRPCYLCRREEYDAWAAPLRRAARRTAVLDEHGRCCGRKPLTYKREGRLFCTRCDAAFSIVTKAQVPNWQWHADGDSFVPEYPSKELRRVASARSAPTSPSPERG